MMTVLGILVGAVLGTRYKVLSLVPAAATGIAAVAVFDLIHEAPIRSTLLTALALTVGLQFGYLVGVTIRSTLFSPSAGGITEPGPVHEQPARIF